MASVEHGPDENFARLCEVCGSELTSAESTQPERSADAFCVRFTRPRSFRLKNKLKLRTLSSSERGT